MNPPKKRGRPRGQRQRQLIVTGDVRLPLTIPAWELDLLKPALGEPSAIGEEKRTQDRCREPSHASQT